MKFIVLTLSLFALLFNAAVAEAAAYNCAKPKAEVKIEQSSEKQPCHTEKAETTTPQTADNGCCGEVCLCIAKATLKTIDNPTLALDVQKGVTTLALSTMATSITANLSAENPPPKLFV